MTTWLNRRCPPLDAGTLTSLIRNWQAAARTALVSDFAIVISSHVGVLPARVRDVASVPPHSLVTPNDLKVLVKMAQEQLGHASISTTPNIYTHVVDASHRKVIEAVERELFPTVPKSTDRTEPAKLASARIP